MPCNRFSTVTIIFGDFLAVLKCTCSGGDDPFGGGDPFAGMRGGGGRGRSGPPADTEAYYKTLGVEKRCARTLYEYSYTYE